MEEILYDSFRGCSCLMFLVTADRLLLFIRTTVVFRLICKAAFSRRVGISPAPFPVRVSARGGGGGAGVTHVRCLDEAERTHTLAGRVP